MSGLGGLIGISPVRRGSLVESWILDKARSVLLEVPLCDRCLGRLFARLGYGWSNKERGDAIKRLLVMELHRRLQEEARGPTSDEERLLRNIGAQALPLLRLLASNRNLDVESWGEAHECILCGGILDELISDASKKGLSLLRAYDIERFVVGAIVDRRVITAEDELKSRHGLAYGESIKAEIRREIGKLIQKMDPRVKVDFEDPEATLLVHFPSGNVEIQVNSLLLAGRYWKLARMVSQAYWPSPSGPRYFSVEEAAWGLLRVTGGERVVIHAAGREDVDARMLGTGRPLILEVKAPRRRHLPLKAFEAAANSNGRGLVAFEVYDRARRRDVQLYKEETARLTKTYRALILSPASPFTENDIAELEEFFYNRKIVQRTPRRVLHRRADITRVRTVYAVKCRLLAPHAIECLIRAEGGLYIKELVSGDLGRTDPSFSSVIGRDLECIELDVVAVEGGPLHLFYQQPGNAGTRVHRENGEGAEGLSP
jgi:tRNA pseudouridine synthase 10